MISMPGPHNRTSRAKFLFGLRRVVDAVCRRRILPSSPKGARRMPPAELNELREECLRHLRLLRVEVDDSQRQLEKLQLPLSAQSRVALLAQLQLNVQRA